MTSFRSAVVLILLAAPRFVFGLTDGVTLSEGAPSSVGMSEAVLRAGVALFEEAVERDDLKGAVLLVARRGTVVLFEPVGTRNEQAGLPMEKDTHFRMASNTKPVVATAILMLEEDGKLAVEDLVRQHIPSWDNYRAGFITIRHLLTHTSGLRIPTLFLDPILNKSEICPDGPCLVAEASRFGEVGAEVPPGTTYSYNNPGYNTLGALIELASGKRLDVFLKERLYDPLGMNDSYNHESVAPAEKMGRVYRREDGVWKVSWSPGDGPDVPFPRASGGMISTAWDYAKFCQMVLNGGTYGGERLLTRESVARATSVQTGLEERYGFGWSVSPEGVYSHGGSDGTFAWVDPTREVVGLIFTQSPGGRLMHESFRKLVEAAIDEE